MRVISGEAKGRKLFSPPGARPTAGKIRESFFNILGKEVFSAKVLDLFAGTGALGIEALSRGAKKAVFVDNNHLSERAVRRNIANLSFGNRAAIYQLGVDKALKLFSRKGYKFDIIFMDPPYGSDLATKTLMEISRSNTLSNGGVVVVEHYRKDVLPEAVRELKMKRKAAYGDTAVSFYARWEEGK
ncbi:MAG: Ribosomal RNA small subunit methyltransferase D [Firmicutes bacterium]|nr:Ribosomal RNA small subunit methyltransferase D [Bacillota bacterium]